MKNNIKLTQWLWRWHFIAGLISLPFIILLSITGAIYLFNHDYTERAFESIKKVEAVSEPISYQRQWEIARNEMAQSPELMKVPMADDRATEFVAGAFSKETSLFVNPYTGKVSGSIKATEGAMYKVRKLHGELLMGGYGTKLVELVASWLVVLIITGNYVFLSTCKPGVLSLIVPRVKQGKRILFRDLHAITGFWISGLLILVLAGAFPWTDVVGHNFKWIQEVTGTGYPDTWSGAGLQSINSGPQTSLDDMVDIAKNLSLPGEIGIELPKDASGVYGIFNTNPQDLDLQVKYHYDQYSGEPISKQSWADVGILMRGRMWVMAFHQGQFGAWNWCLMLFVALMMAGMAISALISYSARKKRGQWGTPKSPKRFNPGYGIVLIMCVLAVLFPLFGLSLILILIGFQFRKNKLNIKVQ